MRGASPTVAQVSRSSLAHNLRLLQEAAGPGVHMFPAIKANAYGHGALLVGSVLPALGYTTAAVAHVREAAELLLDADPPTGLSRLLVMTGMQRDEAPLVAELAPRVEPVVSCAPQLEALAAAARARRVTIGVHLQLDSGMSRQGALPGELGPLAALVLGPLRDALQLRGLMTHFARSYEEDQQPTAAQLRLFLDTLSQLPPLPPGVVRHAANSGAIFGHPAARLEACRPGIALYGLSPGPAAGEVAKQLRPALRLVSRVTLLKRVPRGTAVSYGGTFTTTRASTLLAVVAAGYGDGIPRVLSGKMAAHLAGVRCPQLGRVTMDQIVVDASDVPPHLIQLGMEVR
jgi:alanine racemase